MASRVDRSPVANWWWTVDRWFLGAFLSLMGLGVIMAFAASPAVAERIGLDSFHFVTRQIFFTVPAVIAMIAVPCVAVSIRLRKPISPRAGIVNSMWSLRA
jgi:cell division protein FtsW